MIGMISILLESIFDIVLVQEAIIHVVSRYLVLGQLSLGLLGDNDEKICI